MWLDSLLLLNCFLLLRFVAARHCEGGHICSLPRECCTQGCCPPYQNGPRQLPPPSEHVLNLFFISHWFFWCVVVAIILAILCAYSLWKKRRTLCGWGLTEHHTQSEGDSAGSCYAPPQYSRCNSFHHPPPPYTEVTSKPDLYPLVFTCNNDNSGKNGSSYLMVQYFRNYIVRPVGSLSGASTVDSLSSSFICNNEANTLVPPPYSRAASPEIGFTSHFQQHYMMPRSASQLVCPNNASPSLACHLDPNISNQQVYQSRNTTQYTTVTITNAGGLNGTQQTNTSLIANALTNSPHRHLDEGSPSQGQGQGQGFRRDQQIYQQKRFIQSQGDQHCRYMTTSSSSISDIFVNSSTPVPALINSQTTAIVNTTIPLSNLNYSTDASLSSSLAVGGSLIPSHPQPGGTPVIFSNGTLKANPLQRTNTTPSHLMSIPHHEAIYNSCNSIGGISIQVPGSGDSTNESELRDLHLLLLHHQQQHQQLQLHQHNQLQYSNSISNSHQNPNHQHLSQFNSMSFNDSPIRIQELMKKYTEEGLRSYVTSGTVSGVSSLTNIDTPSSPPQATSPTGEVKEILDQILQLQSGVSFDDLPSSSPTNSPIDGVSSARPVLHHTMSSPSPNTMKARSPSESSMVLQRHATMPEQPETTATPTSTTSTPRPSNSNKLLANITNKRPMTLQKKFYATKPNKALYIPMVATSNTTSSSTSAGGSGTMPATSSSSNLNRGMLKSPVSSIVGANFFPSRSRMRKCWISRSAPTTPGTALPPNRLGDDSPLLNEHDEDVEGEQNADL